jgi:hypothetical protein
MQESHNKTHHNSYTSANKVMVIKSGAEMVGTYGTHGCNVKKYNILVRKSETRKLV